MRHGKLWICLIKSFIASLFGKQVIFTIFLIRTIIFHIIADIRIKISSMRLALWWAFQNCRLLPIDIFLGTIGALSEAIWTHLLHNVVHYIRWQESLLFILNVICCEWATVEGFIPRCCSITDSRAKSSTLSYVNLRFFENSGDVSAIISCNNLVDLLPCLAVWHFTFSFKLLFSSQELLLWF